MSDFHSSLDAALARAGRPAVTEFAFVAPGKPLTTNERLHYRTRATRTKVWREYAEAMAGLFRVPSYDRAHITITLAFTTAHHRDAHNYNPTGKAIVDGLVDAGVLPNDCDCYLTGPDMRRAPKISEPGPVITVRLEAA